MKKKFVKPPPIVIIYGRMASGKTTNASRFLAHYGCRRIVDDWFGRADQKLKPGDLALTTLHPANYETRYRFASVIPIAAALTAIGVQDHQ